MKKILLLSVAMCGAFVMNAMEAPAPEELAKYTAQFNNYVGGGPRPAFACVPGHGR